MEKLFKSVLSIREIKFRVDDDHVDRLSRQHTVIIPLHTPVVVVVVVVVAVSTPSSSSSTLQ